MCENVPVHVHYFYRIFYFNYIFFVSKFIYNTCIFIMISNFIGVKKNEKKNNEDLLIKKSSQIKTVQLFL